MKKRVYKRWACQKMKNLELFDVVKDVGFCGVRFTVARVLFNGVPDGVRIISRGWQ